MDGAHGDGFSMNRSEITILPNGDHPLPYQANSGRRRSAPSTPTPVPTTATVPTRPTTPTPPGALAAQYIGTWEAHGALLLITASGTATAVYRTYTWCGTRVAAPCDSKNGDSITPGGHLVVAVGAVTNGAATGRVQQSDDPRFPVDSGFLMQWSGSQLHTDIDVFCSGGSSCGA